MPSSSGEKPTRVVKIVALLADDASEWSLNRLRSMERYAAAMGWTSRIYTPLELAGALAQPAFDRVVCWRLTDSPQPMRCIAPVAGTVSTSCRLPKAVQRWPSDFHLGAG